MKLFFECSTTTVNLWKQIIFPNALFLISRHLSMKVNQTRLTKTDPNASYYSDYGFPNLGEK